MLNLLQRLTTCVVIFAVTLALSAPGQSQSFSVATSDVPDGTNYDYSFTLNYDQAGAAQTLTAPIFDWSFFVDPAFPAPTQVLLPAGWQDTYDPTSGQFDFFTQGPNGFGNGDFGSDVIQPGQSLSGFGLTTPDAPGLSIATATDEQFNQDSSLATLPTTVAPAAVPEPSPLTLVSLGLAVLALPVMSARRRRTATR